LSESIYATPKLVTRLEECVFYHTMEIPGYGLVQGQWDLRETVDDYLGHVKFSAKRVLELGKASGFLTFHMERQGAEVIAYDLSEHDDWDVVPFARLLRSQSEIHPLYPPGVRDWRDFLRIRRQGIAQLNNGFWLAHRAHGSHARLVTGTAYTVPEAIGPVDVATFGSILLHLRDPFLALFRALRLARETAIVTDIAPDSVQHVGSRGDEAAAVLARSLGAYAKFVPDPAEGGPLDIWWQLSPELVVRWLAILGFEDATVTRGRHRFQGGELPLYTVVARRTSEMDPLG
jgi:hypothetical protein